MRRVGELRHRWLACSAVALAGLLLSGCETFRGRPERLYTVAEEVTHARVDVLPAILDSYRAATTDNDRMFYRNEYISRRMYIIDAEFTEFETALTREREEFGFSTALVTQGLTTAGAVFTPANTVRTLSALAGGVNASRGFYDSELLVGKTIQIIQSQMEAKRDEVAARIIGKVGYSAITYPISAALHDLEDYYRAGTLTAGLIKAAADAGEAAKQASDNKEAVMVIQGGLFQPNEDTTRLVRAYLAPGPNRTRRLADMSACLFRVGFRTSTGGAPNALSYQSGASNRGARLSMIKCAKDNGDPM
ncbi:hypothetical protein SAMN05444159_4993 [Bradyrhizobium lablabi]|uniref:Uncharacterized protein n=1 Tax=Bradyrhizobium lablabi TaxID=722472 RepID=A0A1M6XW65_9BRAD|nr:hypothetical protein [Bradyrhizobium lablabi]SHL10098.1 hypothetical protein SAMN05444159_4993 [Bradyrhizobium lablabi]